MTTKKSVLQIHPHAEARTPLHHLFKTQQWQTTHMAPTRREQIDLVGGLNDLEQVAEQSFDGVWFVGLLPLHTAAELLTISQRLYRLLKATGLWLCVVPDARTAAHAIVEGKAGAPIEGLKEKVYVADILYGPQRNFRQFFTTQSLGKLAKEAGFENIQVTRDNGNLWLAATRQPLERTANTGRIQVFDKQLEQELKRDTLDAPPQQWVPLQLQHP